MNTTKITVQATISAERKKVWDYYTNPKHITKWNFADPSWQCPKAENDLRIGGKYFGRMEAKDGSFGFDFEAIYSELVLGEKFTYDMMDGRKASVNFIANGNKTEVIVTFDAETENSVELQRGGWQAILDNFKNYTESN
ncbi:MAG: SRPBCC family protein [Bacteroidetes bacterium]|nr:SRPBCC family protein [Bacteroidota bacterium]